MRLHFFGPCSATSWAHGCKSGRLSSQSLGVTQRPRWPQLGGDGRSPRGAECWCFAQRTFRSVSSSADVHGTSLCGPEEGGDADRRELCGMVERALRPTRRSDITARSFGSHHLDRRRVSDDDLDLLLELLLELRLRRCFRLTRRLLLRLSLRCRL